MNTTVIERPFGVSAEEKRGFVQQLFTAIAPRYDWFNRLASCGLDQAWRRRAVRESGLRPGMAVLDLCTGTGDLAVLCAKVVGASGVIAGADFNAAMLRGAPRKDVAARIGWLQADALQLPFASERFDRLFIGFSTRNLADLGRGIREMARVLKPGGALVILETGFPRHPLLRAAYLAFLGTVARAIGLLLTGKLWPFTYLARSVKAFLPPEAFTALLAECGLQPRYLPLAGGLASLYLAEKPEGRHA